MKSLKALLIVTLMTASVAAMAEGGGDKVMARMEAARDTSMAYYQQSEKAQAVAADKSGSSNSIERTN